MRIVLPTEEFNAQTDFVDKYLGDVSDDLKNNPKFISELFSALGYLEEVHHYGESMPDLELYISEDGKSFTVASEVRPDSKSMYPELNNSCYKQVRFMVDDDKVMSVITSRGDYYDLDEFMAKYGDTEPAKHFELKTKGKVISVMHSNRMFLDSGIEMSRSLYSDTCPLSNPFGSVDYEIRVQTMNHHYPSNWYPHCIPDKAAQFENYPIREVLSRSLDGMGIVAHQSSKGKRSPVEFTKYVSSSEYPEVISVDPTPFGKYGEKGNFEMLDDYLREYPGMTEWEIAKEINCRFYRNLEHSNTKALYPEIYEKLKQLCGSALEERYSISLDEDKEVAKAL